MRKYLVLLPFGSLLFSCGDNSKDIDLSTVCYHWKVDSVKTDFAKYVDPMIGTAGHGHTFPGACAPFGMVQLSPDTRVDGSWDGCSGYHYDDSVIYGFSHTHLSGTGCSDYGDVLFMPGNAENPGYTPNFCSTFSHKNEKSEAGYYSVILDNTKTKVELTASPRVGVHRYTFSDAPYMFSDDEINILLDLEHRDEVTESHVEIVNDHAIQGYRFSKAWANDQRVYFYAEFSKSFEKHFSSNVTRGNAPDQSDTISGKTVRICFPFKRSITDTLVLKVALSPVSCENAKLNMYEEVPDFDFDAVKKKVQQQWNSELGKIEVKDTSVRKLRTFYTALYHCFISPNLYCDVNGDYWGMDKKVHRDTIHPQYTVFSLWDTYRALHPLFTIIQPKRDQDFINTFLKQYKEGGKLPVWELSANETNCMIGYHAVPVIVDAWMKGLTDFDTALAYEAMKHSAMSDANGLKAYKKFGFIPAEGESESVSKTLEYAYDDWCIAQAAGRMKNDSDYNYFTHRSMSWMNLYDPAWRFMRARMNNSFVAPFDPDEVNFHYTEANAWQYSLAVQQDIGSLIHAQGGNENFIRFLDKLFSTSSATSGRDQADISGMIGQYAQGNEPSHHMAYLYDYTSHPEKTHQIVSRICDTLYTDKPDGLCGNEDCGQMSAWYVMSMMGLYDVTPGSGKFRITQPGFGNITVHFENGKELRIEDHTGDTMQIKLPAEPYAAGDLLATWNGKYLEENALTYSALKDGGEFNYIKCGTDWVFHEDIMSVDMTYPALPPRIDRSEAYETNEMFFGAIVKRTFIGEMNYHYAQTPGVKIFQSVNGSPFTETADWNKIMETSAIKAFSVNELGQHSDTAEFKYLKIPAGRKIKLNTKYQNQYNAGGDEALIDGITGEDNFRTGEWQGYEGDDVDAVIDLGSVKDIQRIKLSCLQDQGSWIFFPTDVVFSVSNDGKNFTEVNRVTNGAPKSQDGVQMNMFMCALPQKARYIKIVAKNVGTCPQWHAGRGNKAWIFADEIIVE